MTTNTSNGSVLAEYANDYRADDYIALLRIAANGGAPDTKSAISRLLGCGRAHADTVTTNLVRKGLIRLAWIGPQRQYLYIATDAGMAELSGVLR